MAKRRIVEIDEEKCTGCGLCIPNCPEGALQVIDGKARLVSDLYCDGLGACIGHCPEDAITLIEREAEPYDERKVMENIVKQGGNTIKAHLRHLKDHNEVEYFNQAVDFLKEKGVEVPVGMEPTSKHFHGCPSARIMEFSAGKEEHDAKAGEMPSQLTQWPIQLHLVSPNALYFQHRDVVLAADCVAYTLGDFHNYLKGKSLAIACPKLDTDKDVYVEKLKDLVDDAKINTLTVMTMEVPCCSGLLRIVKEAMAKASRKIPIKSIVVGIKGNIINADWVSTNN